MYPIDLLFIGKTDENTVEKILKLMFKKSDLKMTRQVFEVYFTGYIDDYFGTIIGKLMLV
jgi:UDP-galactopyranose mutase